MDCNEKSIGNCNLQQQKHTFIVILWFLILWPIKNLKLWQMHQINEWQHNGNKCAQILETMFKGNLLKITYNFQRIEMEREIEIISGIKILQNKAAKTKKSGNKTSFVRCANILFDSPFHVDFHLEHEFCGCLRIRADLLLQTVVEVPL